MKEIEILAIELRVPVYGEPELPLLKSQRLFDFYVVARGGHG